MKETVLSVWIQRVLLALFFLLPISATPWSYDQFELPREILYLAGLWVILLLALGEIISGGEIPKFTKLSLWIPLIAVLILVSWIHSPLAYHGLRTVVSLLLTLAVLWLITAHISLALLHRCLWATLIGGWINSILGISQYTGKDPFFVDVLSAGAIVGRHYTGGLFGNPNLLGIFLAQTIIGTCILLVWNWNDRRVRTIALVSLLLFGIVSFLALALAAIVALAVAAAVAFFIALSSFRIPWRRHAVVGGLLITGLVVLFGLMLTKDQKNASRIKDIYQGLLAGDWEMAGHGRFHANRLAWQMASNRPWFGHGPGTFAYLYFDYRIKNYPGTNQGIANPEQYTERVHDEYLQCAAELGWPALFLVLAGLGSLTVWAFLWLRKTPADLNGLPSLPPAKSKLTKKQRKKLSTAKPEDTNVLLWLGCAWALLTLICTCMNAFANFTVHTSHSVLPALLSVSFLLALSQRSVPTGFSRSEKTRAVNRWVTRGIVVFSLAGMIFLGRIYWANCLERSAFQSLQKWQTSSLGQDAPPPTDELIRELKEASSLDPSNFHVTQMLGAAHLFRREPREALAALSRSLRWRKDPETYLNYGIALAEMGRTEEARESFRQGLLYLPHHSKLRAAVDWLETLN